MKIKKFAIKTFGVFVILIITAITIWDFSLRLKSILQAETERTLTEVSEHYNKVFSDRIEGDIKVLNVMAGNLEALTDKSRQNIERVLRSTVEYSGLTRLLLADVNGIGSSHDGVIIDISTRDYFQKAMGGETVISAPLFSAADDEEILVVAVPVQKDGKVLGVLCGAYLLPEAGKQLLDSSYYSGGYGFIISKNGDIVISSTHADNLCDEDNLLTFFNKTVFVDSSVAELEEAMKLGKTGTGSFSYDGKKRFVNITPSGINDWYTVSLASDALILQQENATNYLVFQLFLKLTAIGTLIALLTIQIKRRHNKEVITVNQRYESLINHINGGVIVTTHSDGTRKSTVLYVSNGFTEMTGYTLEDIGVLFGGEYFRMLHDNDRQMALTQYREQTAAGNSYRMSYRFVKKDGSVLWVMDTGYVVEEEPGSPISHSILTDITVLKQQEEEIRLSSERFRIAIQATHATIFEIDLKTKACLHFENTEALLGTQQGPLLVKLNDIAGRSLSGYKKAVKAELFHPADTEVLDQAFAEIFRGRPAHFEARMRRMDGSFVWCKLDIGIITGENGVSMHAVGYITDISSIKSNTAFLENQAQIDLLTGLYNKATTAVFANNILSSGDDKRHALIILDIDNFKGVNDTLGHVFGDSVLMDVGAKLKALFREDDVVGRIGGDEFAILMRNVQDVNRVLGKAAEIGRVFRQTYTGERDDYKISCSMGIIMTENSEERFDSLYPKADAALYQAKRSGRDRFVLYRAEDAKDYLVGSRVDNDAELQSVKEHWNIEERIFKLLYDSKNFSDSINMALALIGRHYHVSRAYVWENDPDNHHTSSIYEWCNHGITSEINHFQNVELSDGRDSFLDCFDENGLFYCNNIETLPDYPKLIFERQGILSTLQTKIMNDGKTGGFIGLDECTRHRVWTVDEVDTITFLSEILSTFLLKRKAEAALAETLSSKLIILDSLPEYICVINPENHSVEYANHRMQELLPNVHNGSYCFTTLRGGQEGPCETCLVDRIKRGDTDNLEIISEDKGVRLKVKALYINWSDQKKKVLLYGQRKEEID